MQKSIKTKVLADGNGIVIIRGNIGLAFTKPGIKNIDLKSMELGNLSITSILTPPTKKSLKRNYKDFVNTAQKHHEFSNFSLIRRINLKKLKKVKKVRVGV